MCQGKKRTKASNKAQTTPSPGAKKAKAKTPIPASLKAKNSYNHFYTKEVELRKKEFMAMPTTAKKKVSQKTLGQ